MIHPDLYRFIYALNGLSYGGNEINWSSAVREVLQVVDNLKFIQAELERF